MKEGGKKRKKEGGKREKRKTTKNYKILNLSENAKKVIKKPNETKVEKKVLKERTNGVGMSSIIWSI